MPAKAGNQVTDSVRHTVGIRYPGDDKAGTTDRAPSEYFIRKKT